MKFCFDKGTGEDYDLWTDVNAQLLDDLRQIAAGKVNENELAVYLRALCEHLTERETNTVGPDEGEGSCNAERGLFLQFADPDFLTPDDRVDFIYRPTYIAASVMMTAFYRFRSFRTPEFTGILRGVLNAAMERDFTGAGYLRIPGLLDALEIFAEGDSYRFIREYGEAYREFARKLSEAVAFLNDRICTGEIRNPWLDDDYIDRGIRVRDRIDSSLGNNGGSRGSKQ